MKRKAEQHPTTASRGRHGTGASEAGRSQGYANRIENVFLKKRGRNMRAFLSHSSTDKAYVSSVAKQLGRQYCIYDLYSFETGNDFREAIRTGLNKSSIFVLFASKQALKSVWVRFEQDEAEVRAIKGMIKRPLVFLIGANVNHNALPEWLSRGRVVNGSSPKAVAREIQHYLQEFIRERQQPIFVGRHRELAQAEDLLLEYDIENPRRIFAIHGLSGIGRRTLARRVGRDLLSLSRIVVLRIEEGDGLHEIAAKISEHTEIYSDMADLKRIIDGISASSEEVTEGRIKENLEQMVASGELPVFFDAGGLLSNDGYLSDGVHKVIHCVSDSSDIYLNLVTGRKLYHNNAESMPVIPTIRVEPLKKKEIERLIGTLASRHNIKMNRTQVKDLSEYVRGYPPAAHYAMELMREYGVDAILAYKYPLVEFRTSHFIAYLSKEDILKKEQRQIIGILSYYSPLPLSVIGKIIGLGPDRLASHLNFLVDTCIVLPDENGLYAVSDPIVEAAQRIVDRSEIPHKLIADALDEYIREDAEPQHLLSVGRSLFRARRLSGEETESSQEISLVSDLIALETQCYHSRDYDKAIEYGLASLESRPDSTEARTFVIRALAQLGRFTDTKKHIEYLRNKGQFRDVYFLEGFIARLQGRTGDAVSAYEESIKRGRRGLAVQRELASCYFILRDMEKAQNHITIAQSLGPDNRYVVDLQIIIAVHKRDEDAARRGLELLMAIDRKEFYMHRLSTVELVFGRPQQAYEAAKAAIELTNRPTFAMYTQAAKTAIACGDIDNASIFIDDLEKRFRGIKNDIRTGLRCRWEIAARQYSNALSCYELLSDKDNPIHKALRRDLLNGLLSSTDIADDQEKKKLQSELEQLEAELANVPPYELTDIVD